MGFNGIEADLESKKEYNNVKLGSTKESKQTVNIEMTD
jgi:hypothetical protein